MMTDWRTLATEDNQQRFADAQARLDEGDYPLGESGDRQRRVDEKFTDWYDANVLSPAHDAHERQGEIDEFNRRFPEPADGARIEWEQRGILYAAHRQDLPEYEGGSWWLYGIHGDDRYSWMRLLDEFQIGDMADFGMLTEVRVATSAKVVAEEIAQAIEADRAYFECPDDCDYAARVARDYGRAALLSSASSYRSEESNR